MAGRNPARTRGPVLRRNAMDAASASPGSEALCDGDGQEGTHGIMIPCHHLRHQPTRSDTAQSQQVGHRMAEWSRSRTCSQDRQDRRGKLALTRDAHSEADDGGGAIDEPATEQFIGRRDPNRWSRRVGRGRTRPSSIPVCLRQPRAGRDRHHRSRHCRADHLGQRGDLRQHQSLNGLSSLDEPVLSRAVSLRKPQATAQGRGVGCHVVGHPVATGDRALVEDRRGAP